MIGIRSFLAALLGLAPAVATAAPQDKIAARPLTHEQVQMREQALEKAAYLLKAKRPLAPGHLQHLYDAVAAEVAASPDSVTALGVAFGSCLVGSDPTLEWLWISDEYGEELGIGVKGSAIYAHPISMIQKRLDRREATDIASLCADTIARLKTLAQQGQSAKR